MWMALFFGAAACSGLAFWKVRQLKACVVGLESALTQERAAHDKCRDQMLTRAIEEKAAAYRKDRREGDRAGVMGVAYDDEP